MNEDEVDQHLKNHYGYGIQDLYIGKDEISFDQKIKVTIEMSNDTGEKALMSDLCEESLNKQQYEIAKGIRELEAYEHEVMNEQLVECSVCLITQRSKNFGFKPFVENGCKPKCNDCVNGVMSDMQKMGIPLDPSSPAFDMILEALEQAPGKKDKKNEPW